MEKLLKSIKNLAEKKPLRKTQLGEMIKFLVANWARTMFGGLGAWNIPRKRISARKLLLGGF